jgi:hypothetical protein
VLTVSATLVHPLTETRLPTLAQTSALATPEGCTTAYISGIDVRANTAIPAAVQDRTHRFIAISSRHGRGFLWPICEPVVVKEAAAVVTVVVKRSKTRALKPHFRWWS